MPTRGLNIDAIYATSRRARLGDAMLGSFSIVVARITNRARLVILAPGLILIIMGIVLFVCKLDDIIVDDIFGKDIRLSLLLIILGFIILLVSTILSFVKTIRMSPKKIGRQWSGDELEIDSDEDKPIF